MKKKFVSAFLALVGAYAFAAPMPARADAGFSPSNLTTLGMLFPDTCIPIGTSEYCISFTNAAYLAQLAMAGTQNQMGSMLQQGLQDGRIGSIEHDFGLTDVTGLNNNVAILGGALANPKAPVYGASAAYLAQQAATGNTNDPLYQAMVTDGGQSALAQEQLNGVALMKLVGAITAGNTLVATQQQESAKAGQTATDNMGSYMDLNGQSGFAW